MYIGTSKATCHLRSISLPSVSHPLAASVDEQLSRLTASQPTPSFPSSSILGHKLDEVRKLYECIDDFLQLSHTKQDLSKIGSREEVCNGSVKLLEMCDISRDVLSQMKECLRELESSLRRTRGGEGFANEVSSYIICRKKISKVVFRSLKNLKSKCLYQVPAVTKLQEAEQVTLSVFETLLSLFSTPKSKGLSSIIKVLPSKRVSCDNINEVADLDAKLVLLNGKKSSKDINLQCLSSQLESLNLSIQEMEENLECVYRRLVKNRVTLLNILNN